MALVTLAYTTLRDNHLVRQGVWSYGEGRVVGTVGYVPLEEYLFFVLQPLLAGLWLYRLLRRRTGGLARKTPPAERRVVRLVGASVWLAASLGGLMLLGWDPGLYLGLIPVWASPVLAGQWAYGGEIIWGARRIWLLGTAVPTVLPWASASGASPRSTRRGLRLSASRWKRRSFLRRPTSWWSRDSCSFVGRREAARARDADRRDATGRWLCGG